MTTGKKRRKRNVGEEDSDEDKTLPRKFPITRRHVWL